MEQAKQKQEHIPPPKKNYVKGWCCFQTNIDRCLVMEETIYLKVERGM
jgi:hypothetical protein